jgi:hypothetical protein
MPLGIDIAATLLEVPTPGEITMEIARSLDFLAANEPDRPERQHSLRAVFDRSWKMLAEKEYAALMAYFFLGERMTGMQILGGAIILAGVVLLRVSEKPGQTLLEAQKKACRVRWTRARFPRFAPKPNVNLNPGSGR